MIAFDEMLSAKLSELSAIANDLAELRRRGPSDASDEGLEEFAVEEWLIALRFDDAIRILNALLFEDYHDVRVSMVDAGCEWLPIRKAPRSGISLLTQREMWCDDLLDRDRHYRERRNAVEARLAR